MTSIRYRPMRPSDVRACAAMVAAHPVRGLRFGKAVADLAEAWRRLLLDEAPFTSAIFEQRVGTRTKIVALGVSVFISDDFVRELKAPPGFWMGPELARRTARGDSPVLTEKQVREANSRGGLNLAVWLGTICKEEMQNSDLGHALMVAFMDLHQGYLLKELVGQAESVGQLESMYQSGGRPWNFAEARYGQLLGNADATLRRPHIMGATREIAVGQQGSWGTWIGSLFRYRQPQLGFSRSEQRLLFSALDGSTDGELSDKLGLSLTTVKKTWRSIYDRAAAHIPELVHGHSSDEKASPERGKAKKQYLIAYLREHPEELRPVSRKLL